MLKFLGFLKDRQNQLAIYIIVISGLITGTGYFINFGKTLEATELATKINSDNCVFVKKMILVNEHKASLLTVKVETMERNAEEQKENQKEMIKLLQELQINAKAVSTTLDIIREKH